MSRMVLITDLEVDSFTMVPTGACSTRSCSCPLKVHLDWDFGYILHVIPGMLINMTMTNLEVDSFTIVPTGWDISNVVLFWATGALL